MRAQINIILISIIVGLVILNLILYTSISNVNQSKEIQKNILYQRFGTSLENSISILPTIYINSVKKDLGFLLSYYSMTTNSTYCDPDGNCVDIKELLYRYFYSIYGDRWNLTIRFTPGGYLGWIVKMFVVTGNSGDFNVCAYDPPDDNNGKKWYEYDYNGSFIGKVSMNINGRNIVGSGWVDATIPFSEYASATSNWGLQELFNPASDNPSALRSGVCVPLSNILNDPSYNLTDASIFCPAGEWDTWGKFWGNLGSTTDLPTFFSDDGHYFVSNPPYYKTDTDITALAYYLGIINDFYQVVGSFYYGNVTIIDDCVEVYMDVAWHEVVRTYISYIDKNNNSQYVFLVADPYCNSCPKGINSGDGKNCPLVYKIGSQTNAWSIYRFNITKWAIEDRNPNNKTIKIANAYWDPHPGSNGVSVINVYCKTKEGQFINLNSIGYYQKTGEISLGYPIPDNVEKLSFEFYYPTQVTGLPVYLIGRLIIW